MTPWRLCGRRKMLRRYCTNESRFGRGDGRVPSENGIHRALVGFRSIRTIIRNNGCNSRTAQWPLQQAHFDVSLVYHPN